MRSLDLNKEKSIQAPDSWKFGKLSDIALITMGQSPPGNTYNSENKGIPILNGPTEFTDYYPIPIQFTTKPTKISKAGDILYCVRGSSTGRMNFSDREYCIGRGLASIRQKANSNTKYIYYILTQVTKRIFAEAKGAGSTFPNISRKGLEKTNILIPPIDEQNKIAEIFSTVDDDIKNTDSIIKETQQLKKGLMEKLFTEGIAHKQFKKIRSGKIPESWSVISFLKASSLITDQVANGSFASLKANVNVYDKPNYALYVRLTDLREGLGHSKQKYADKKTYDFLRKSKLYEGDILIANIGANVGEPWIMPNVEMPATIAPNMLLIRTDEKIVFSRFLYYYLLSKKGQFELSRAIAGSGQPKLNKTDLKKIKVCLPPIVEQYKITVILSEFDEKIKNETDYKSELEQLKKGLLQVLLTGKVRVKV